MLWMFIVLAKLRGYDCAAEIANCAQYHISISNTAILMAYFYYRVQALSSNKPFKNFTD